MKKCRRTAAVSRVRGSALVAEEAARVGAAVAGEPASLLGDPRLLRRLVRNLLENAVKYSDAPVEVNVRVRGPEDGRVKVEISDRGIGIPSDELHKIFQRFYRAGRDVRRMEERSCGADLDHETGHSRQRAIHRRGSRRCDLDQRREPAGALGTTRGRMGELR